MDSFIVKRKYPRRLFHHSVGVLKAGTYKVGNSTEIGEGGIRVLVDFEMEVGDRMVVTFMISSKMYVVVETEVRYSAKNDQGTSTAGLQFIDLGFESKRAIRDYIAAKTESEAVEELKYLQKVGA